MIDVVNARTVTIYLWHFTMLITAHNLLGMVDRPQTPGQAAVLVLTVLVLTGVMAVLVGWVEDLAARRPPRLVPRRPRSRHAVPPPTVDEPAHLVEAGS